MNGTKKPVLRQEPKAFGHVPYAVPSSCWMGCCSQDVADSASGMDVGDRADYVGNVEDAEKRKR